MPNSYFEKLRNPLWQKKRLEIMHRDSFTCQDCEATNKTLNVHHKYYRRGKEPWEYPNKSLITLCEDCHLSRQKSDSPYDLFRKIIDDLLDADIDSDEIVDFGILIHECLNGRSKSFDLMKDYILMWGKNG